MDSTKNKLSVPGKISIPALHQRLKAPAASGPDVNQLPNRIALMLDASGSMIGTDDTNKPKIEHLRDAVTSFISACNLKDTALSLESFGDDHRSRVQLTTMQPLLMSMAMGIEACGSTPMHEAMDYVLNTYSITRGVIVSDGMADNPARCEDLSGQYKEAGIPIDTVHIGYAGAGEDLLKRIAERTGGKYIKFTDVASFGKNFKYLTPAFYAQLTSGSIDASLLGAKEIK